MKNQIRWFVLIVYPMLFIQIALMLIIYLRIEGIDNEKVDCPVMNSFKSLAYFKICVLSIHLIFLCFETLSLLKYLILNATNKCKPRSKYYYESSDEEDDRNYFE